MRWGILGVSFFAVRKMIPAMKLAQDAQVVAIASRSRDKAEAAARDLDIPRAHGSYQELLDDPDVEAIYNPLPNHLHVPWSVRAAEAGKHVLCEKPIALDARQAQELVAARDRTGVLIHEAAMVRVHPRWLAIRDLLRNGRLGELRSLQSNFSYDLRTRDNVRYQPDMGGGALLDIGFYPITISRFCFEEEPTRVIGLLERDPQLGVDRLTSAILDFPRGQSSFTCGMQVAPFQHLQLLGTRARMEVEIPWTPDPRRSTRILLDDREQLEQPRIDTITFDPCNQYTVLVDLFARAARQGAAGALPALEDSVKNMAVMDAILLSARSGRWETPAVV
jgi:predicted dehydrogenase